MGNVISALSIALPIGAAFSLYAHHIGEAHWVWAGIGTAIISYSIMLIIVSEEN